MWGLGRGEWKVGGRGRCGERMVWDGGRKVWGGGERG